MTDILAKDDQYKGGETWNIFFVFGRIIGFYLEWSMLELLLRIKHQSILLPSSFLLPSDPEENVIGWQVCLAEEEIEGKEGHLALPVGKRIYFINTKQSDDHLKYEFVQNIFYTTVSEAKAAIKFKYNI